MRPQKFLALTSTATFAASGAFAADLAEEPRRLGEIVVTTTLSERGESSSPAFTTIITAEQIEQTPTSSLGDLLREQVGITNQTDNTGRDEIQIRGMDGGYTLILVDGKRVSSAGALWRGPDFDLNTIPLASIERIEIVRGPMSVLYGSDAIGGVINIITKRAGQDWHGHISSDIRIVESGDKGAQQRLSGNAAGPLSETVSLALAAETYHREAWYADSAGNATEVPALEQKRSQNLTATTTVKVATNQHLDLDLGYNHDVRPYGLYSYTYYPAYGYESYGYSKQDVTRSAYGLTHTGKWDWGKTVSSVKHEVTDIDDFNTSYNTPQQRSLSERNTYAKTYAILTPHGHTITAGLDYRDQEIEDAATYLSSGKTSVTSAALFAQDEMALGRSWLFTLGGRLDAHDDFGTHLSPKGYLNYLLSDSVTIKGGIATAFKAPQAYQLSSEYSIISCGGACYLSGNPDLKPETSLSYELGVEVDRPLWSLSADIFHNKVKDMIVAVYDSTVPSRAWQNVAKAKTYGLEISGTWKLHPQISLDGNLALLRASYTDYTGARIKLDNRPETKGKAGIAWQATSRFNAGLAFHYTGKQYYDEEELPGYWRMDLTTVTRLTPAFKLHAGVRNLTDVNLKEKSSAFLGNELGRNYYLGLGYDF